MWSFETRTSWFPLKMAYHKLGPSKTGHKEQRLCVERAVSKCTQYKKKKKKTGGFLFFKNGKVVRTVKVLTLDSGTRKKAGDLEKNAFYFG